jgi:alpha-galactosidase
MKLFKQPINNFRNAQRRIKTPDWRAGKQAAGNACFSVPSHLRRDVSLASRWLKAAGNLRLFFAAASLVTLTQADATPAVKVSGVHLFASTTDYRIDCNLSTGTWSAFWGKGGHTNSVKDVTCGAVLKDGRVLDSAKDQSHICDSGDITALNDKFGRGVEIIVHHRQDGSPELLQKFELFDKLPYFLTSVDVSSNQQISSNYITVLACTPPADPDAGVTLDSGTVPQTLSVPYDNDAFVRYMSSGRLTSYEVTAFYDNDSRHGFVIGSVTHDTWKTGIKFDNIASRRVGSLTVFGGIADKETRDTLPHGFVSGLKLKSPVILVGWFPDWRTGLVQYGIANAKIHPPINWPGGVPFGWNSWMAYQTKIDYAKYIGISDFYKKSLTPSGFSNNGTVYMNLDSYWDNMTDAQLKAAVIHVHQNGQKAGIYWTPFVDWGSDLSQAVPGSNGLYKYQDIVLKDSNGNPVPRVDGAAPLDPSHPGTLGLIDFELARFVALGIDYIKLDFLTHGAIEGAHFDSEITTGTEAYNVGMQRIDDDLNPKKVGRPIFISLSIAPLFPCGYGHSRRIACDTWGWLANSEYLLNSLNYGWWEEGSLYRFNDPDNVELIENSPLTTEQEGRTRFNASVIAGTVLLDSDPLMDPTAQQRAMKFLTNPEVNAVARISHSFRPVEGNTGQDADDTFTYNDTKTKSFYIALFNFDPKDPKIITLNFARLGLSPSFEYDVRDLWAHQNSTAKSTLAETLLPGESTILKLTAVPLGESSESAK